MKLSWRLLLALLVIGAALAKEEEDVPDAGVEDDDEDDDDHLTLNEEESRNLRPRAYSPSAFNNAVPSGFRPTPSLAELAGYQRPQEHHRSQDTYQRQQEQNYQRPQEQSYHRPQQEQQESYVVPARAPQQQLYEEQRAPARTPHRKHQEQRPTKQQLQEEEELEEKEEPDRLSQLLQQSRFDCVSKQAGYYADEELNCEVFHYCHDSVKHSWICPDGFTFHQVHLICMPPTHDNICQKSSKYHFVNEYLYKPVNEEEVQRKPNVSLRYSDRYYPAETYRDDRYDQDEDEEEEAPRRQAPAPRPAARPQQPQPQQPQQPQHAQQQVFRSAEEVNIPLVQRRPQRPYDFDF